MLCGLRSSLALDFSLEEQYRKGYNKGSAAGRGGAKRTVPTWLFPGNAGATFRPQAASGSGVSPVSGKNVHFCDACKNNAQGIGEQRPGFGVWKAASLRRLQKRRIMIGVGRPSRLNKRGIWARSRIVARKALRNGQSERKPSDNRYSIRIAHKMLRIPQDSPPIVLLSTDTVTPFCRK